MRILFFLLLVFPSFAFAVTWQNTGGWYPSTQGYCDSKGAIEISSTRADYYKCVENPANYWTLYTTKDPVCTGDDVWNQATYQCEPPEDPCENSGAPQGSSYNSQTESCDCPAGQEAWLTQNGYACQSEPDECTAENATGTVNGQLYCEPQDDSCPAGTTGGYVNGGWRCIDEPPQCSAGETYINGSCIGPEDYDEQGDDGQEPDYDGDGKPNSNDDDIDGDGTPNSQDGDSDGDGIPNEDDPTPSGDDQKQKSATTSGTCEVKPTCSGDAIQCAILIQSWQNHCDSEEGGGADLGQALASGGTDSWWESEYENGFSGIWSDRQAQLENSALVSWLNSWGVPESGSCPNLNISLDLGFINFGSGNPLADYCYIFSFIRLCILITASFLARALIFGG